MNIVSVNLARAEPLEGGKTEKDAYLTGIYKRPVAEAAAITKEGLAGDAICNPDYHGGADQAVYLYGKSDYAWWESTIGRTLPPGIFGENLTLDELDNSTLVIGDRYHIGGEVILEVTAPRIPCATLSRRMGDPAFLKKFRGAARPGAYCRVVREGMVAVGDSVRHESFSGEGVTMLEIFEAEFVRPRDVATLRRHLAAPLASRIRIAKEKQLLAIEGQLPE